MDEVKVKPSKKVGASVGKEEQGPGMSSGRKHPKPEKVRDAKHNPKVQKKALGDNEEIQTRS